MNAKRLLRGAAERRGLLRAVPAFVACLVVVASAACTEDPPTTRRAAPPTPTSATATPLGSPSSEPTPVPDAVAQRTEPAPGEVVFYRVHPDPEKVDPFCGAHDRSYVVRHVEIAPGDRAVLTRALEALFERVFRVPRSQIERVAVVGGMAIVDLRSMDGLGWAGTSCGGNGFLGSLLRTAFQFESVESVQIRLGGSCKRFGDFRQSGICTTYTRQHLES